MPSTNLLTTELFMPPNRPEIVSRPRLIKRLNGGLHRKLTLVSAPAGFGKTTLLSEWLQSLRRSESEYKASWLSLDENDSDLTLFLTYLIASLRKSSGSDSTLGVSTLNLLEAPQPPSPDAILISLINELAAVSGRLVIVLDDYQRIDSDEIDKALTFILARLPPQLHFVMATRFDPRLPLASLRARDQLTEIRVVDLQFSPEEAAEFLNGVMGLNLSDEDISALGNRTEGWIAGLQLAAISMRAAEDTTSFIQSFAGSHRFVLDYLIEEVLEQQSEDLQAFLLQTSILDRLNGSLCNAVTGNEDGQQTLEFSEQSNLFVIPQDEVRVWYRYHNLFADLLKVRLQQAMGKSGEADGTTIEELHTRASVWYESQGMAISAFQHAVAANDVDRAYRLMQGEGMPLQYRGVITPVMNWLASLPEVTLNARPALWVQFASVLTMAGQPINVVEDKLGSAEAALETGAIEEDRARDLIGHIAAIRAMLALTQNRAETMIQQSERALEYLRADRLSVRANAEWTLGYAHQLQGNRVMAITAYRNAISMSQATGNKMIILASFTSLGQVQESELQLHEAAESYQGVLQLTGDPPWPSACEAYLGLARISYEWNALDSAQEYAQQSLQLAQGLVTVDTPASCHMLMIKLALAHDDTERARDLLLDAEQFVHQGGFDHLLPKLAALKGRVSLREGDIRTAAQLAQEQKDPIGLARVHIAREDPSAALQVLAPYRRQAEEYGWKDEILRTIILEAIVQKELGEEERGVQLISAALDMGEGGGMLRTFIDQGDPVYRLVSSASAQGHASNYSDKLLRAFKADKQVRDRASVRPANRSLIEPLSQREFEVLELIARGLTNREIGEALYIALDTVKGYNRSIYSKLGVQRRTEAVARARELGLL